MILPMECIAFGQWGHQLTCEDDLIAALIILEPVVHLLTLAGYEVPEMLTRVSADRSQPPRTEYVIRWRLEHMRVDNGPGPSAPNLDSVEGFVLRLRPTALALDLGDDAALFGPAPRSDDYGSITGNNTTPGWLTIKVIPTQVRSWQACLLQNVNKLTKTIQNIVKAANPNTTDPLTPDAIRPHAGLTQMFRARMWFLDGRQDGLPRPWTTLDHALKTSIDGLTFESVLDAEVKFTGRTPAQDTPGFSALDVVASTYVGAETPQSLMASLGDHISLTGGPLLGDADPADQFPGTLCERLSLAQFLLYAHYLGVIDVLGNGQWCPTTMGRLTERVLEATKGKAPESKKLLFRSWARKSIPQILRTCVSLGVTASPQVAYILATAAHESRFGCPLYDRSESLVEDHNPYVESADKTRWTSTTPDTLGAVAVSGKDKDELELKYWYACYSSKGAASEQDAAAFKGRGYVQLTHRDNYKKMTRCLGDAGFTYEVDGVTWGPGGKSINLETNFKHVNEVMSLAAWILVHGMQHGDFRNCSLSDYLPTKEGTIDYYNARNIVNGSHDCATEIKTLAVVLRPILDNEGIWDKVIQDIKDGKP